MPDRSITLGLRRSLLWSVSIWAVTAAGAHAACAPAAPNAGQAVECTDVEPNGFVAPVGATDLSVNIRSGATVTGSQRTGGTNANNQQFSTVFVRDGSTVNNAGLISVTDAGARVRDNYGVNIFGSNVTVDNSGTISLSAPVGNTTTRVYGAFLSAPDGAEFEDVTIVNRGTISVTQNGNGIARGIYAGEEIGELSVRNSGLISATRAATATASTSAVAAIDSDDDVEEYEIRNSASGRIVASGSNTRAINGRASTFEILNEGLIQNLDRTAGSAAIALYAANVVQPYESRIDNTATGVIDGDIRITDVDQQTAASTVTNRRNGTINNEGTINGSVIFGNGNGTINNDGTISGGISFLDVATAAGVRGSINTVTLGTNSVVGGPISARGLGLNTLVLADVARPAAGGGDDDDDDDDDRPASGSASSGNGRLSSNVTGFTRLLQTGGTWTLAAGTTQSFSQRAVIDGGTLIVDSTLNAPTFVEEAGKLGGSGTIFGNLSNEGTVAPGSAANPYGRLTVNGNYAQDSSGRFSATGSADGAQASKLQVNGSAELDGTAEFRAQSGQYRPGTRYNVLTATGGVSGAFSATTKVGLPTLLGAEASYDDNNAYLTIVQGSFTQVARTQNQRQVATGFDALLAGRTDVLTFLNYQSDGQLASILDRAAGQGYASLADPQLRAGRTFADLMVQRGYAAVFESGPTGFTLPPAVYAADLGRRFQPPEPRFVQASRGYGVWATGFGQFGQVGGNTNAAGRKETLAGFAGGVDVHPTVGTVLGISAGYTSVDVSLARTGESARTDNAQVGLYGGATSGAFYGVASVGYARAEGQVTRSLGPLQAFQPNGARGNVGGNQFLSAAELGYRYAFSPNQTVLPFVGYQVATFNQDAVRENGGGLFNLRIASQDYLSARSLVGVRIEDNETLPDGRVVTLALKAAYVHDFADVARSISANFALAPAVPFTVQGVRLDRDRALFGLGIGTTLAPGLVGFVNGDAEVATTDTIGAFRGGVRYTF